MAAKNKRGLGRGLDGMIPAKAPAASAPVAAAAAAPDGSPLMLDIRKIKEDKSQPRENFNEDKLQELADSITEHGIIEPLVVTPEGDGYVIVAGERRWRAAGLAGLSELPVIIRKYENAQQRLAEQIIENLQREDLNPIEEAKGFLRLKEEFNLTDDEVAKTVSKSRAAVTNAIRLLRLDVRVQQMVIDEQLTMGHARALLAIEDAEQQYATAQDAFDGKLSVRELEKLVKKLSVPAKEKKQKEDLSQYQLHFDEYAGRLAERLGVKVSARLKDKNNGRLEIDFYDLEDFDKIYEKLSRD